MFSDKYISYFLAYKINYLLQNVTKENRTLNNSDELSSGINEIFNFGDSWSHKQMRSIEVLKKYFFKEMINY